MTFTLGVIVGAVGAFAAFITVAADVAKAATEKALRHAAELVREANNAEV